MRAALAVPAAVLVLAVAACGGTGDAGSSAASEIKLVDGTAKSAGLTGDGKVTTVASTTSLAPSSAPTVPAENETAKWVQLSTNETPLGTTVTDVQGFTLYRFDKDKADPPTSNCTGDCAQTWPPVLIQPGGRVFVDGVSAKKIGAIRRSDGGVQVTIAGWPVYRFAKDTVPGDLNGQGVGGTWFAFKPSGGKITSLVVASAAKPAKADPTKTLTAQQTKAGIVVADDDGATLYRNVQNNGGDCTDTCAAQWRPVVADAKVTVSGVSADRVGTKKRDDGSEQLTLDGKPLWRNAADKSTGTVIASAAEQGWEPAR